MSYCRWSSDGFNCDIYCYESVGDYWVVHVAANRRTSDKPRPVLPDNSTADQLFQYHRELMTWVDQSALVPIGLGRDGKHYDCDTAEDAAALLIDLKNEGYIVPQYAIDELLEEASQPHPEKQGER